MKIGIEEHQISKAQMKQQKQIRSHSFIDSEASVSFNQV